MYEVLIESLSAVKKNKTRTALTGFGVAWGIFILVLLLSASNSFNSGIRNVLGGLNSRDILFSGGVTSNKNYKEGLKVDFEYAMLKDISKKFREDIDYITPVVKFMPQNKISHSGTKISDEVLGVNKEYFFFDKKKINGRGFNKIDYNNKRKVVLIGQKTKEKLFGEGVSCIGSFLLIDKVFFKIIGVFKSSKKFDFLNSSEIIIPLSALNGYLKNDKRTDGFRVLPSASVNPEKLERKITKLLYSKLNIHRSDKNAIAVINSYTDSTDFRKMFNAISGFLWFVGVSLLTTGVIGISNIMYISVKERTQEIGIRKALGAEPNSIIKMFLIESLIITIASGLIGLLLSFSLIMLINLSVTSTESFFGDLNINYYNSVAILTILILSGVFAGIFPAKKAALVKPVEAINYI
ncbi:ABC transporter permease [Tenacibaculum ovolyticum]|uniref:ABC transporter permease n=1 Tax=Tenacibaculum ovolyticum TaxID=104270 RepID=UPI0007EC6E0A|nr:ABC transporter permease [Tenacibaculum ovolyticum]